MILSHQCRPDRHLLMYSKFLGSGKFEACKRFKAF
jgi:hypothetical protein